MRTTLLVLLALFSLGAFAEKWSPDYFIAADSADRTVAKTQTKVVAKLVLPGGKPAEKIVTVSFNRVNSMLKPDASGKILLNAKPGKYVFIFFYDKTVNEVKTDSIILRPGHRLELQVNFSTQDAPIYTYKPVIYVYSPQSMPVKMELSLKGKLDFTYPEYKDGWNFTAEPGGEIKMGDRTYPYLFWDGTLDIPFREINTNEGFEVSRDSLVPFFEKKLGQMGLSPREIEDYITFWVPKMKVNAMNFIHFFFNEQYNAYAGLKITPRPDQLFRVFMLWKKTGEESSMEVKPQQLPSFTRSGFTVVEWGGAEMGNTIVK